MPRNEAADRYSPEMAAAFSPGGTSRAATRKSSGVLAIRTPRAPTATVSSVTAAIAATAGTLSIEPSADRVNQVDEACLQLAGLAVVEPADGHEHREDPGAQDDKRERQAGHRGLAGAGQQGHDQWQGSDHRERDGQAHQGQPELCPGQRPDKQPAVDGVALDVPEPDDIVLDPCLVVLPDDNLPAPCAVLGCGAVLGRRGQCRRPARSSLSLTSRAWRRLTGSHWPDTLTLWLFPATANSAIWLTGTR